MEAGFIPGIYNYCDRWCERCPLRARCRQFAEEQGGSEEPDSEESWADTLEHLRVTLALSLDVLAEEGRRRGLDMSEESLREAGELLAAEGGAVRDHPLSVNAMRYVKASRGWQGERGERVEQALDRLELRARLGGEGAEQSAREARLLRQEVELIARYGLLIYTKLQRALGQGQRDPSDSGSDAAGSAKVALIGIERSLAAWTHLRAHVAEEDDAILDLLIELGRLRRRSEAAFPAARSFVRPGFDDGTV